MKKIVLGILLLIGSAAAAQATVIDIPVTAQGDASYWWSGRYSGWDPAANPNSAYYSYWVGSPSNNGNSALQFDLSSLSTGSTITSATFNFLIVGVSQNGTTGAGYLNHQSDSSGANGDATQGLWGDQTIAHFTGETALGWTSIDVTSYVQNDYANNYHWSAFGVTQDGAVGSSYERSSGISYGSAEGGNPAFLRITTNDGNGNGGDTSAVPEPASIVLLGLGGAGMLLRRLRHKNA